MVPQSIMIGSFQVGNVAPNMQAFGTALGAAATIYSTIDRKSPLDATTEDGATPEKLQGTIRLEHVKHIYPSRPEVVVMEDVALVIPAGKTTALVGASGSGKSTIAGLFVRGPDSLETRHLITESRSHFPLVCSCAGPRLS